MGSGSDNEHFQEPTFFQRFGFLIGIAVVAVIVGLLFYGKEFFGEKKKPRKPKEFNVTRVLVPVPTPPPPPPPPKPPEIKQVEDKMVEQAPVDDQVEKPDEPPPQASPDVGTGIVGDGPGDGFGLSGRGSGMIGGGGPRKGGGGKWGWYASQVQGTIAEQLKRHPKTRKAEFRVDVRIWPDASGRISRAKLMGSTGDSSIDAAIADEILDGMQLKEPPPPGMPSPIVLRFTARRPN
jgi:outer membrane biosynthesis protein TonB